VSAAHGRLLVAERLVGEVAWPDRRHHLLKRLEAYQLGAVPQCAWTDRMLFQALRRELLVLRKDEERERDAEPRIETRSGVARSRRARSSQPSATGAGSDGTHPDAVRNVRPPRLTLHFPAFTHPVVFEEPVYCITPAGPGNTGTGIVLGAAGSGPTGTGGAGGGPAASDGYAAVDTGAGGAAGIGMSGSAGSGAAATAAGAAGANTPGAGAAAAAAMAAAASSAGGAGAGGSAVASASALAAATSTALVGATPFAIPPLLTPAISISKAPSASGSGSGTGSGSGGYIVSSSAADAQFGPWSEGGLLALIEDAEAAVEFNALCPAPAPGSAGAAAWTGALDAAAAAAMSELDSADRDAADGSAPPADKGAAGTGEATRLGAAVAAVAAASYFLSSSSSHPVEAKYHRMARGGLVRGLVDPNLKPSRGELVKLQMALSASSLDLRMPADVAELLWKFRYFLCSNRKALVRFLASVDWDEEDEVAEVRALLTQWAAVEVEDAIRLLSPDFPNTVVREFAVAGLARATDEELVLFLPQLVQALRYEPALVAARPASATARGKTATTPNPNAAAANGMLSPSSSGEMLSPSGTADSVKVGDARRVLSVPDGTLSVSAVAIAGAASAGLSPLADFLISRACRSPELGNFLFTFLTVECEDRKLGHMFSRVRERFRAELQESAVGRSIEAAIQAQTAFLAQLASAASAATSSRRDGIPQKITKLNAMLSPGGAYGGLCALAQPVTLPLNPDVLVSGVSPKGCHIFKSALYPTVVTFALHPSSHIDWTRPPQTAGMIISREAMAAAQHAAQQWHAQRQHNRHSLNAEAHKALLVDEQHPAHTPAHTDRPASLTLPVPVSLSSINGGAQTIKHYAVQEDLQTAVTAAVAASGTGTSAPAGIYKVIFKNGDDMRQDQLIIQMIRLMDRQLKRVGLDLRLTPYRVLATSSSTGIMEMVLESMPVSAVMSEYKGDIMAFFRAYHPKEKAEYGIDPETMDTYVKSCAGYCVVTYILGIGDRHLDNIMLRRDGHMFHIDFGYIFGKDPKPFPPPVRLTREMIAGMGGPESANYQRFKSFCCQAYNILRKSANLILSLLNLMREAGIEALAEQPDLIIAKIQDKFHLELDDEAADQVFLKLVDESVAAMFPAFFEVVHKIRLAMR
jgi:phosphatidylinositol 3-kinase